MIYTGAFMAVGVGGAALSIDIGRIVLLRTQMQNRADAGALAGAAQLDAQDKARERATAIIEDSMTGYSTLEEGGGSELAVWFPVYFDVDPDDPAKIAQGPVSTTDNLARFAQVVMQRRTISFFYGPALNILTGQDGGNSTTLNAMAIAMSDPFICKMQPLMICEPFDDGDPLTTDDSITNEIYRGFGLRIKQGPSTGAWTPGNFGLLQLPDDAGSGAIAVLNALSAEDPLGCYAVSTIETSTGTPIMSVVNGINVRWEGPKTARNLMNYPRDDSMIADETISFDKINGGVWNLTDYWTGRHGSTPMPVELLDSTRYLVYLFEQGTVFWAKNGGKTLAFTTEEAEAKGGMFPVNVTTFIDDPTNYPGMETFIGGDAQGHAIPYEPLDPDNADVDGIPPGTETGTEDISTKEHLRRVLKVVVAKCAENNFTGASELPSDGAFLELFLTEEATNAADGALVHGEIVRTITANTSLEFHGNVRLVQ